MATFRCEHTEYHDDMYPEFAPDPIEVTCGAEATQELMYEEYDQEGTTQGTMYLCKKHCWHYLDPNANVPFFKVLGSKAIRSNT